MNPTPTAGKGSDSAREVPKAVSNLDPSLLAGVKHKSLGILEEERDAYYQVLNIARNNNFRQMVGVARANEDERITELARQNQLPGGSFPIFVDIFRNPERWQGKLVTLRGHVRQVISYPAGENTCGLKTLHEAWIYTEDSQSNPAVIICTEIPPEMPTGTEIVEEALVTGYFFKMYGYRAQDTTRVAPMILAKSLEWIPATKPTTSRVGPIIGGAICVAVMAVLWLQYRISRRDRAARKQLHQDFSTRALFEEISNQGEPELPGPDQKDEKT